VTSCIEPTSLLPGEITKRVDHRISELLDDDATRWAAVDPDLEEPLWSLSQLVLAGGKRLRPAFCYWAFIGAGGDPDDPAVIDGCAALELLHTFALIHDDIMDGSCRRRGMDAVHHDHARRHAAASWSGESRRFGEGVGILVGDLAFVYADIVLADAPREAWQVFNELRLELSVGQYLDLLGTARRDATPQRSATTCRYKSAKYTVERPLHLGAALAGTARLGELSGPLSAYGLPLGEAFQLRDDLLGAFGDPAVTGKPVGDDLGAGKPTFLSALARSRASGPSAELLRSRIGQGELSGGELSELQAVLESTGARREVEARIDRLIDAARGALDGLRLEGGATQALGALAAFVAGRSH